MITEVLLVEVNVEISNLLVPFYYNLSSKI